MRMHLLTAICGISLVVCVLLDSSQGKPQVACQQALLAEEIEAAEAIAAVGAIEEIGCPAVNGIQQQVFPSPISYQQAIVEEIETIGAIQEIEAIEGIGCPNVNCYQQPATFIPSAPVSLQYPSQAAAAAAAAASPFNAPCTNCEDYYLNIPTINATLAQLLANSPYYLAAISGQPYENLIDSACYTFLPLNGQGLFLEFVAVVSVGGVLRISTYLVSSTGQNGLFRVQGLENGSGVSSVVANTYAYAQIPCPNCTSVPLTAFLTNPKFADCSVAPVTVPYVYALSATPNVSPACLTEAAELFSPPGIPDFDISFPSNQLNPVCVTSVNGVPVINAASVPPCSSYALPPPPASGCNI